MVPQGNKGNVLYMLQKEGYGILYISPGSCLFPEVFFCSQLCVVSSCIYILVFSVWSLWSIQSADIQVSLSAGICISALCVCVWLFYSFRRNLWYHRGAKGMSYTCYTKKDKGSCTSHLAVVCFLKSSSVASYA